MPDQVNSFAGLDLSQAEERVVAHLENYDHEGRRSRRLNGEAFHDRLMRILRNLEHAPFHVTRTETLDTRRYLLTIRFDCQGEAVYHKELDLSRVPAGEGFGQYMVQWQERAIEEAREQFRKEATRGLMQDVVRGVNQFSQRRLGRDIAFFDAIDPINSRIPYTTSTLDMIEHKLRLFLGFRYVNLARNNSLTDFMQHYGRDVWHGKRPLPKSPEYYEWMRAEGLPAEITYGNFKARLIDNTMSLYEEGTKMEHCIYNASYYDRIKEGKYLVYHIDGPLTRSGFTLGLIKKTLSGKPQFRGYPPRFIGYSETKYSRAEWRVEQLKARKNSTHHNGDPELHAMVQEVVHVVNHARNKHIEEEVSQRAIKRSKEIQW